MKRIKTISEFHQFRHLPAPEHPLISVTEIDLVKQTVNKESMNWCYDFYAIGMKRVSFSNHINFRYGQQPFDFNEGILSFVAPNQLLSLSVDTKQETTQSGWLLLIHSDFLWNTPLAKSIRKYDFWDYSVHESLFLSVKEEATLIHIFKNIQQEYHANIDRFSKQIIIAQIESLLTYADRFYHRQFITREKTNHQLLEKLETLLDDYFSSNELVIKGVPTVQYITDALNVSPNYLRGLLKVLTGQNTQQLIHDKLIEKAKEKLSVTDFSISEIAYALGFEHPQSFTKLFKSKTNLSPLAYRQSFN
ncbi:helix-turn-helix domain-containing protein [Mucilaginibacter paludis]|uniref:Transcriptional regulator, AraC family n=1 Tax=Mucilaginibacter paludis DSM 18603 TaxID=714943 RepID=H1YIU8_9SPHI|nr:response regulator transcription factor [Mucilaginibacter paludis]EHQ27643.1 transcriptional regulator, AraC family [Mucilaginibacter paludis DSM 18603]